jgi:uncharacterized membrane protein YeaQ/YmgE (transglycosylase-associated protein family)
MKSDGYVPVAASGSAVSTLVYLVISAVIGCAAGGVRAGRLPYAAFACTLAAVIASITLSLPLGDQGPHVYEVAVVPAAVGAVVGALLLRLTLERLVPRTQ